MLLEIVGIPEVLCWSYEQERAKGVPIGKRKKRLRRRRREALVHGHLENVSRDLLENHRDIVRDFIGRNAGIYALYRKNRLYYVGLATALRGRLKAHGKDAREAS
jgi:hypothetical protein